MSRTRVPLLQCSYDAYVTALFRLLAAWLDGRLGDGAPTDDWERNLIHGVNMQVNVPCEQTISTTGQAVQSAYKQLQDRHVLDHFRIVTSHRYWLRKSHEFLVKIGIAFSEKMGELIMQHDMSKYTHRESLGYAVMFGDGRTAWRKLEDNEKTEWETTLENHYAYNPHHPEYFGYRGEIGSTTACQDMASVEDVESSDFIIESVIDMLASRGERVLKDDPEISISQWMTVDDRYLKRYTEHDRRLVQQYLLHWRERAATFMADNLNVRSVDKHFDSRSLVP